jgi:hypothetical protein
LSVALFFPTAASAGPKGRRRGGSFKMGASALAKMIPDKVLPLYSDDAVLWGTLSPTVRADRAALRDYFVAAFKVLPGLKAAFGRSADPRIRRHSSQHGYYTFSFVKDG